MDVNRKWLDLSWCLVKGLSSRLRLVDGLGLHHILRAGALGSQSGLTFEVNLVGSITDRFGGVLGGLLNGMVGGLLSVRQGNGLNRSITSRLLMINRGLFIGALIGAKGTGSTA